LKLAAKMVALGIISKQKLEADENNCLNFIPEIFLDKKA